MLKHRFRRLYFRHKTLRRRVARVPMYAKLTIAAVLLLPLIPLAIQYRHNQLYTVEPTSRQLLPKATIDSSKIKQTDTAISYNEADQNRTGDQELTIAGPTEATGQTGYQANINKDFNQGMSFGDSSSELSFKLKPLFKASKGEYKEGQVMFPISASTKIFQTFKKNGVKEDIVLSKAPGKTASYSWELELSDKLTAKLMPDGSVGIFAANPSLYGNLQVSDEKSQKLINKAKTTDKNYQIFTIPAPYIKNSKGQTLTEGVSFKLEGGTLTLEARNLTNQHYPISIDPSVVVTTTSNFRQGSDDGMVNYGIPNQIGRSDVSLGSVGATSQQTNAFTTARDAHASVVYNGYLYIIGGSNYLNDIQHCPINADGSVGTCIQQTNAFTGARRSHTSVAYNGYLYIMAGYNNGYFDDIQHCPINTDGSVGTCVQQTGALVVARTAHSSAVYNGYLYIIGGINFSNRNDIERCPINADGSVGTCVQQTNAFTTARVFHTSVAYNGYLYIVGGQSSGGTNQNDVQYCPINANGSIGTCVQQTNAFTTARNAHTSIAYNGYLYVIGGNGQNDIQHCPINANGSVGTCVQQTNAFTNGRSFHASIVYNGYIYIIGGDYIGTPQNDIQRVLVDTGAPTGQGAVGSTSQQTNAFTAPRTDHTSVAYNGYLYIIGGSHSTVDTACNGTASSLCRDIIHCPINADGSVGTCVQQTNAFTTARYRHTSVAYNGYLYVIGGYDGSTRQNDIQHCPINADGSVGTCVQQTNAFTTARYEHTSVAYNGYLYIIGGSPSGGDLNDIQHCPINADGSVGTCVQQTNAFTSARYRHTSVAYNGYLYVIGGDGVGGFKNDIQHCPINTDGSVGTCVQQTSAFTTARGDFASVAYNGYLYVIGGISTGSTYQNDIQHCPINTDGSVGTCVQQTSAFTTARATLASVAYNGYLYVIGGSVSSTTQNDIQHLPIDSMDQKASYERIVDIGALGTIQTISFNGQSVCGARLSYRTATSSGVFGSASSLGEVIPATTYTINANSNQYIWLRFILDDTNCGTNSNIADVTVTYNLAPATPTLTQPTPGQTELSTTPEFRLYTTDPEGDYLRYQILIYLSNCSTLVRTIDQTASQTGWAGQSVQSATAYSSGQEAIHTYQPAALTANTTYCWKATAIDPAGTNIFNESSATRTFTTAPTTQTNVNIGGGTIIYGGSTINP